MKAYMELVNNMLLTAEVQQTIVTPHIYISACRQESFLGFFPILEMLFVDDVISFGGERRQELSTDCLLKCSCRHQPHVWFPPPDEVCHVAVEGTEWKMPAVPGILPQLTAGQALPGYRLPQRVCSLTSVRLASPVILVSGWLMWCRPSMGTVLEMLAACRWPRSWGLLTRGLSCVQSEQWELAFSLSLVLVLAK